jgi:hypothetical protein
MAAFAGAQFLWDALRKRVAARLIGKEVLACRAFKSPEIFDGHLDSLR